MIVRTLIYGILGWSMEIMWTGLGSLLLGNWQLFGFTYLWMFPIYCSAVFLEPVHDRISHLSWYWRGLIWAVLIFLIEYGSGATLSSVLGRCPWDYSGVTPYHINGLIRLDFAPAWFFVGLGFEKAHLTLDRLLKKNLAS